MAIVNILKGLIGKEDLAIGSGTFDRLKSDGSLQTLNRIGFSTFLSNARTPQDYGALGDGSNDDFGAMQDCFDAGGFILIPPGTYLMSQGPIVLGSDYTTVLCLGTIKLATGATHNGVENATAIVYIEDAQGCVWIGGVLDGNNVKGPNGIAVGHNLFYSNKTGAYSYRTVISDVTIRNCRHNTDVDPGGDTPHNGGVGNGGGKGVTVQFGAPQCSVDNVRVHDCTIGITHESGTTLEREVPDLHVSNLIVKDCMIGAMFRGVYGGVDGADLGSDANSSMWSNVTFLNCGTANAPSGVDVTATDFGVIDAPRGTNVYMSNLRIRNTTGIVTPFRGIFRNCHFQGEVDAPQIKYLLDFRRNKNGSDPGYTASPTRHCEFDIRLKLHGAGSPGDQITHALITDAAGGFHPQYNRFQISYLIGDGANDYLDGFSEITAPFYDNDEDDELDSSNWWTIFDRGTGKWRIGSGITRNLSGHHLDGMAPAFPTTALGAMGNLWAQNDQQAGILRLHAADETTKIGLGTAGGLTSSTVCYADTSGLVIANSSWDGRHLVLGTYHLWVDATGDLRIKGTAPTSDTDGTIVGTQS